MTTKGGGKTHEQWPVVVRRRPGEARCNLLRKIEGGGTIKEEGDAQRNPELDGSTMKLSTTKCRQLPIVVVVGGGDICGVDTDAEKEMKSEGRKGMTVFTAAAA